MNVINRRKEMRVVKLRLCGFTKESVVDGPGLRAVVYAQGCSRHCRGCQNPETWDPDGGYEVEVADLVRMIKGIKLLRGITLSGGEPFEQASAFAELAREIKEAGLDILTYTGYTFEELQQKAEKDLGVKNLLENTDILIDGPFREEERDLSLAFRGSRNQRMIDVRASIKEGRIVTWQ